MDDDMEPVHEIPKVITLLEQFVQTEAARWERFDKLVMKEIEGMKIRLEAHEKRLEVLENMHVKDKNSWVDRHHRGDPNARVI